METFSGKAAGQREYELVRFIDVLKEQGVRTYLEIGVRFGDTFHAVMSALPVGSVGVAVDLPESKWGKPGSKSHMVKACEDLRQRGYVIHEIYGNSTSEDVIAKVAELGPYDAGLIDGDHTITGISADWAAYSPQCRITALHDIAGRGLACKKTQAKMGVPDLWDDVKRTFAHTEIIEPGKKMGIGVAYDTHS